MVEMGIFHPEERLELLSGKIIKIVAKGTAHEAAITRIQRILNQRLGDQVLIMTQSPITLDDFSEPEPDVAVVKTNILDYEDHHLQPSAVFLLIEVTDSSLKYDREVKSLVYAKSGIMDYWVLDVHGRKLSVYRDPSITGYQSESILGENLTISPLAFPGCEIKIRDFLRKV